MPEQQQLLDPGKGTPLPSTRREGDKYYTPQHATAILLERCPELRGQELLDPCCGDGRMAEQIMRAGRFRSVRLNDLDGDALVRAHERCPVFHLIGSQQQRDAADPALYVPAPCWSVSNPPFSAAGDITWAALQRARHGVAMLLRSPWGSEAAGSTKKHPRAGRRWLTRCPPTKRIELGRVCFTGNGKTDMVPHTWFIWLRGENGLWLRGTIEVADGSVGQEVMEGIDE